MLEQTEENDGTNAAAWIIGVGIGGVVLALLMFAYMIGFNRGEDEGLKAAQAGAPAATENRDAAAGDPGDEAAPDGQEEADGPARDLFVAQCGSCHVLAAAGTEGTIGPDLDQLAPDEARALAAIENGGTGAGQMPANLVSGQEAEDIAGYIAGAAGP